jgi:hypothetical protein
MTNFECERQNLLFVEQQRKRGGAHSLYLAGTVFSLGLESGLKIFLTNNSSVSNCFLFLAIFQINYSLLGNTFDILTCSLRYVRTLKYVRKFNWRN